MRKERLRLGLNQTDFAEIGGVQKDGQVKYEADKREPGTAYMTAIVAAGVDVLYVLTGVISDPASDDEGELLSGYRELDERSKTSVLGMIDSLRPRRHVVSVNLSDEDFEFYTKQAEKEGVSVGVVVRKTIMANAEKILGLPPRSIGRAKIDIAADSEMGKSVRKNMAALAAMRKKKDSEK
ncbi:hypothetical protein SAMN04515617_12931 [Collimonas sp. OK242]|uniref:hypothetical protein n=1 Tax=Collimonas sp. OK242 TaxID=1798195 RepID=UPI00089895A3|nr:hypothetical protein [Collimonas sp. OK242]SDY91131.1 hypothetical protein SAMN04515617_12931 [Collimonas sp. OK242]